MTYQCIGAVETRHQKKKKLIIVIRRTPSNIFFQKLTVSLWRLTFFSHLLPFFYQLKRHFFSCCLNIKKTFCRTRHSLLHQVKTSALQNPQYCFGVNTLTKTVLNNHSLSVMKPLFMNFWISSPFHTASYSATSSTYP